MTKKDDKSQAIIQKLPITKVCRKIPTLIISLTNEL